MVTKRPFCHLALRMPKKLGKDKEKDIDYFAYL